MHVHPDNIYLFKVNNINIRKRCDIYSKLTIKTPERRHWRRSSVFMVNFEYISHLFLVFLLLTLTKQMLANLVLFSIPLLHVPIQQTRFKSENIWMTKWFFPFCFRPLEWRLLIKCWSTSHNL